MSHDGFTVSGTGLVEHRIVHDGKIVLLVLLNNDIFAMAVMNKATHQIIENDSQEWQDFNRICTMWFQSAYKDSMSLQEFFAKVDP